MTSPEITDWLRNRIAETLGTDPSTVDATVTFDRLGLDSLALLGLIGDQGQRPLLQHLGPRRTQRQQPNGGTQLIGNPAVEVTLHHLSIGQLQRSGCPRP